MENIKWNWVQKESISNNPILLVKEYGEKLKTETNGIFEGKIIDSINEENNKVTYSFFINVPSLRYYSYKLLDLSYNEFYHKYPIEIKLYLLEPSAPIFKSAKDLIEFKNILKKFISEDGAPAKKILDYLNTLIQIKQKLEE